MQDTVLGRTRDDFFREIHENVWDFTRRAVFADWLEEHPQDGDETLVAQLREPTGKAYLKGFLKEYAGYLVLDRGQVLAFSDIRKNPRGDGYYFSVPLAESIRTAKVFYMDVYVETREDARRIKETVKEKDKGRFVARKGKKTWTRKGLITNVTESYLVTPMVYVAFLAASGKEMARLTR